MGVPRFFNAWVRPIGGNVIPTTIPKDVSSLSIDMNGMLHQVAQRVYAYGDFKDSKRQEEIGRMNPDVVEREFHLAVAEALVKMNEKFKPKDLLIIAVDGVAPIAKIQQQRQRRYRSALGQDRSPVFDTAAISPGTDFMINFDNFFKTWLEENQDKLTKNVIYSSHMVRGEGEHKIMDYYRNGILDGLTGVHLLHGLDADLILLSLLSPIRRIILVRDDPKHPNFLDVDRLREYIQQRMTLPTAIPDFSLMMSLLGNDFLPHTLAFEDKELSIDKMIDIYTTLGVSLVDEGPLINWYNFGAFLDKVLVLEQEFLLLKTKNLGAKPSLILQDATVEGEYNYERFRAVWYNMALGNRGEQGIEPIPSDLGDLEQIDKMATSYLNGLSWVMLYYTRGLSSVKGDYFYPFLYSPLIEDLTTWAGEFETDFKAAEGQIIFSPLHQLVSIIPPKSIGVIPKYLKSLYGPVSPIIDLLPTFYEIDVDKKGMEHMGVVIIPPIEPLRIVDAVDEIKIPVIQRKKWAEGKDLVLGKENMEKLRNQRELSTMMKGVRTEFRELRQKPAVAVQSLPVTAKTPASWVGERREAQPTVVKAGQSTAGSGLVVPSKSLSLDEIRVREMRGQVEANRLIALPYTPSQFYVASLAFGPGVFSGKIPKGVNPNAIM